MLITVENTITPPVTSGYWTEAGKLESAISKNKLPTPFKTPYPDEYKRFLPLTSGIFLYCNNNQTPHITTEIMFIKNV